jgi:hypothetical protein
MKNDKVLGWHFCDGWKLRDGQPLVVGKTYHIPGELVMCERGLHMSRRIIDALQYAPGSVICRVEGWGVVEEQDDKLVCHHRKVLAAIEGEKILHRAACHFAADALRVTGVTDNRCWTAINTKRRWIKGLATDTELDAARTAGTRAARAAADVAWDAIPIAATAWDRTVVARCAAADAIAAWEAAKGKQNCYLERVVGLAMKYGNG